jgi:uncharacterized membrane protein (UPF0127 family)
MAVAAVAAIVVFAAYETYFVSIPPGSVTSQVPSRFTVNGKTFVFNFTATTQAERQAGLMNKDVTGSTTMLFAFPSFGKWSFWMYDTNTSLDMIWLNATGSSARVVYLITGAPPCYSSSVCVDYTPSSSANYVIEARAGFAAANGIVVGTYVELS